MAAPRTWSDVRNHPMVEDAFTESDYGQVSYWVHLKQGYWSPEMECGTIHEWTVKDVCRVLNNATRREAS